MENAPKDFSGGFFAVFAYCVHCKGWFICFFVFKKSQVWCRVHLDIKTKGTLPSINFGIITATVRFVFS